MNGGDITIIAIVAACAVLGGLGLWFIADAHDAMKLQDRLLDERAADQAHGDVVELHPEAKAATRKNQRGVISEQRPAPNGQDRTSSQGAL